MRRAARAVCAARATRAAAIMVALMALLAAACADAPADGAAVWTLHEELRIGSADGDGADVFGAIGALGVSPRGEIHVIDAQAQELRVFSADGAHLRTIGRRGGGPGEFAEAYGLAWDGDGRLWVVDAGNARYAVFDADGTFLHHVRRAVPGVVFPWIGGFGRDGALYDVSAAGSTADVGRFTFYRVAADGAVLDSFPPVERRTTAPPLASLTLFMITPRLTIGFDPAGYVWFGDTGEYRIGRRTLAGDTVLVIDQPYAPVAVPRVVRDSIARELAGAPPPFRDPPVPATLPPIGRLRAGDDGTLYVHRLDAAADGGTSFDVFDAAGRFIASMHAPVRIDVLRAPPILTGDAMLAAAVDDDGVPYVLRARIAR